MKKFTLFLFSMFCMLGMAAAQNEGEDPLELKSSKPANGELYLTVYNIELQFNKEVAATLPAGGIDVKNTSTGEIIKITRVDENEWIDKNTVVFLFEQKSVVDKEGKEELQDQYIESVGTYSFTIPAGCIKSVNGEEFAEHTFTFTIAPSMEIVSVTPEGSVAQLDKIEITFPKAIARVRMPEKGLSIVDGYWSPVKKIKNEVVFSEDRKIVTLELEEPITEPGTYNFDISAGVFVSEDGDLNIYKFAFFEVVDPTPSFFTNYNDGDRVQELGNLEIAFKNVNEVKLVEGADPIVAYLPGGGEVNGTAALNGNVIVVAFDQQFTEEGTYTFSIPAGAFTMDGAPNEARDINVVLYKFEIKPLEIVNISPAQGNVDKLESIIITFNQDVTLSYDEYWQQISREIKLVCGDKEYTLTYNPISNVGSSVEYLANAVWDGYDKYNTTPITEEGTYKLNLADIVVDHAGEQGFDEWGWPTTIWHSKQQKCEGTAVWTVVSGESAIEDVLAGDGAKVIYDLTGRKVEQPAKGVYIINGKKTLVK